MPLKKTMKLLYKLGSSLSSVSISDDIVYKRHAISSKGEASALNAGLLLLDTQLPGTVQMSLSSNVCIQQTSMHSYLVYEYTQLRLRPWIQSSWITGEQLYQLGDLILRQQLLLNENGLSFCDARPDNYFLFNQHKLVDLASIKHLSKQVYLSFQSDFVTHILAPLKYELELGMPVSSFFKARLNMSDIKLRSSLRWWNSLPALSLMLELLTHKKLSQMISRSSPGFVEYLLALHSANNNLLMKANSAVRRTHRLLLLLNQYRPLENRKSHWSDYGVFHDPTYIKKKHCSVSSFIGSLDKNTICIDLGSNTTSMDIKGISVFVDKDFEVCNKLRKCADKSQVVLCADIAFELLCVANQNTSTCLSFGISRSAAIATSLIHHIILDQGLTAECFYLSLSRLYSSVLLEFVLPSDPMIKLMIARKNESVDWCWSQHKLICQKWFDISEPRYLSSTRFVVTITNRYHQ